MGCFLGPTKAYTDGGAAMNKARAMRTQKDLIHCSPEKARASCLRRNLKGWFPKGWFWALADVPPERQPERVLKFRRVTIRGAQPSARLSEEICLSEGSAGVSQRAPRGLSEGSAGSLRGSAGVRVIFPRVPGVVTLCCDPRELLERGYVRMFPRNENRNEGTFAKTTLLRNRAFISQ